MRILCAVLIVFAAATTLRAAEDPVFSGPQVSEALTSFPLKGVFGDAAGKDLDVIADADDGPVVLIFVHERTRPAFGLMRTVMRMVAGRRDDGIVGATVFLTDDLTETENWMNRIPQYFPEGITIGISPEGQEGPGAYGLNRNVALTVLVGNEDKVTANFALVQPSVQADGPKIFAAIVDALGGGEVPDVSEFSGPRYRGADDSRPNNRPPRGGNQTNENLRPLLQPVIDRNATAEEVAAAAKAVEEYAAEHPEARLEIGRIGRRIVEAGVLENYGTAAAQEYIRKWAKEYTEPDADKKPE
jgi:hypothetical protein